MIVPGFWHIVAGLKLSISKTAMLLRTPALAPSSSSLALHQSSTSSVGGSARLAFPCVHRLALKQGCCFEQRSRRSRTYATGADKERRWTNANSEGAAEAPPAWPRMLNPTPYDIFGMHKEAAYNKRRYFQLVKLYHPDMHEHRSPASSSSFATISQTTRLERYRLLVAANDLLSDPEKRRLYDVHGLGWTGDHRAPSPRDVDRSWRYQAGSAANNATWEDWERWHAAREGRHSKPVYMSHGMFATIIVMMCMIGALAQSNRADMTGEEYMEWTTHNNAAIGRQLRTSTMASAGRSKDERVDNFLKDRENVAYDFEPGKYESPPSPPTRPS